MLWAYDFEGQKIHVDDPSQKLMAFARADGSVLTFNFCSGCGCVVSWRARKPESDGRIRIAVNLRLAEPDTVAAVPLLRFDGLHTFEDLPLDGRTVHDMWF